jgi:hypothetical protein
MLRGLEQWLWGYLASVGRRRRPTGPRHVLLCIADHFEPFERTIQADGTITGGTTAEAARAAVDAWCADYAACVGDCRDADGCTPRHTTFYPWDEYDPGCLDRLAAFCRDGHGEVEMHLHHRHDTPEGLRQKLHACREAYAGRHGLLGRAVDGSAHYAFVHGNWALCNARPDGDWCGVDRELAILRETGCYADFTFPSAPSPTQPRIVNAIYYGRDPQPGERGHQELKVESRESRIESRKSAIGLLMVQGPLGLNWRSRKAGLLPRLENAELSNVNPATVARLARWMRLQVHVPGRADWVAVKLHTHGMSQRSRDGVVGPAMRRFHEQAAHWCAAADVTMHYVTARELYNIIKAAEAGHAGNPGSYRDFELAPPPCGARAGMSRKIAGSGGVQ